MIFLVVGNVVLVSGTSAADEIRGLVRRIPISGVLLVVGLFAVTGSPPFGMFISEVTLIQGAISTHHPWIAASLVVLLSIIFVGIGAMILDMVYGEPPVPPLCGRTARCVPGSSWRRSRWPLQCSALASICPRPSWTPSPPQPRHSGVTRRDPRRLALCAPRQSSSDQTPRCARSIDRCLPPGRFPSGDGRMADRHIVWRA